MEPHTANGDASGQYGPRGPMAPGRFQEYAVCGRRRTGGLACRVGHRSRRLRRRTAGLASFSWVAGLLGFRSRSVPPSAKETPQQLLRTHVECVQQSYERPEHAHASRIREQPPPPKSTTRARRLIPDHRLQATQATSTCPPNPVWLTQPTRTTVGTPRSSTSGAVGSRTTGQDQNRTLDARDS